MATFSKRLLSGSVDGRPVSVTQLATPGNLVHTAHATAVDEVWLYAVNRHTVPVKLTIEFGGITVGDSIEASLDVGGGAFLILPGVPLTAALAVRAFAAVAGVVSVFGWVNRIE